MSQPIRIPYYLTFLEISSQSLLTQSNRLIELSLGNSGTSAVEKDCATPLVALTNFDDTKSDIEIVIREREVVGRALHGIGKFFSRRQEDPHLFWDVGITEEMKTQFELPDLIAATGKLDTSMLEDPQNFMALIEKLKKLPKSEQINILFENLDADCKVKYRCDNKDKYNEETIKCLKFICFKVGKELQTLVINYPMYIIPAVLKGAIFTQHLAINVIVGLLTTANNTPEPENWVSFTRYGSEIVSRHLDFSRDHNCVDQIQGLIIGILELTLRSIPITSTVLGRIYGCVIGGALAYAKFVREKLEKRKERTQALVSFIFIVAGFIPIVGPYVGPLGFIADQTIEYCMKTHDLEPIIKRLSYQYEEAAMKKYIKNIADKSECICTMNVTMNGRTQEL